MTIDLIANRGTAGMARPCIGFFGFPDGEKEVILAFALFAALVPWLTTGVPGQRYLKWFSITYPFIATVLLAGALALKRCQPINLAALCLI